MFSQQQMNTAGSISCSRCCSAFISRIRDSAGLCELPGEHRWRETGEGVCDAWRCVLQVIGFVKVTAGLFHRCFSAALFIRWKWFEIYTVKHPKRQSIIGVVHTACALYSSSSVPFLVHCFFKTGLWFAWFAVFPGLIASDELTQKEKQSVMN